MVYYTSGTASQEVDLIPAIETFLVGTVGWVLLDKPIDTASNKHCVFFSRGSTPGKYRDLYISWQASSDYAYNFAYTLYINSTTYSDLLWNPAYGYTPAGGTNLPYWLFGTKDWMWMVYKNTSDNYYYSLFAGYIDSYYTPTQDDLPVAYACQMSASTDYSGGRVGMYAVNASGTCAQYFGGTGAHTTLLANGSPNARDGSFANYPVIIYNSTAPYREVRGELPGVLAFGGAGLSSETWVTISGTGQKYFIQKYNDDKCWGYGPVPV
jgi:hypothetical protein